MRRYPRLGCPIVDEIAVTASAPELAMASQLLKASCASYTQRARSACFVPSDFQKKGVFLGYHLCLRWERQNNRNFTLRRHQS